MFNVSRGHLTPPYFNSALIVYRQHPSDDKQSAHDTQKAEQLRSAKEITSKF